MTKSGKRETQHLRTKNCGVSSIFVRRQLLERHTFLPVLLFFFLPAEMDSGHKGRQGNQARQGHYQHNIASRPVHYLEQQRQTQQTYGGGS